MLSPSVVLYAPKSEGAYLIQRQIEYNGHVRATGPLIEMSRDALLASGITVIETALAEYPEQRDIGDSPETSMSPVERWRFHKQHITVTLTLSRDDELSLMPIEMDETGRFGRGCIAKETRIPVPLSARQLVGALDALVHHGGAVTRPRDDVDRERFVEHLLLRVALDKLPFTVVCIYVPEDGSHYVLQRMTEKPGLGNSATDQFVSLTRDELTSDGAEAVLDLLITHPGCGLLAFQEMPFDLVDKLRGYACVGVSLLSNLTVRFDRLDDDRVNEHITIPVPFTARQFIESLDAAVRRG
jgi:hypothetical protein